MARETRRSDIRPQADLRGLDLSEAYLAGVVAPGANLSKANLAGADLRQGLFCECSFAEADLRGADLSGADLVRADLRKANLCEATMCWSDLAGADLTEADLGGADMLGANLGAAKLLRTQCTNTRFKSTSLRRADLTGASFVGVDLTYAIMEDAVVGDAHFLDLAAFPRPPTRLRLDSEGNKVLSGEMAERFFRPPVVVEVFFTEALTSEEIAFLKVHLAAVQYRNLAVGIRMLDPRHEAHGSVLRFEAQSSAEIYQTLPTLLTPFRMARAVDWRRSLETIPPGKRTEAITTMLALQTEAEQWQCIDQLAEHFAGLRNARLYKIKEGTARGLRLEVFTDEGVATQLSQMGQGTADGARLLPGTPREVNSSSPREAVTDKTAPDGVVIGYVKHMVLGGESVTMHDDKKVIANIGGDATNVAIGENAKARARDIEIMKGKVDGSSTMADDVKAAFKEALDEVERLNLGDEDKSDALDDMKKLRAELDRASSNPTRIKKFWHRVTETVGALAEAAGPIATLGRKISSTFLANS